MFYVIFWNSSLDEFQFDHLSLCDFIVATHFLLCLCLSSWQWYRFCSHIQSHFRHRKMFNTSWTPQRKDGIAICWMGWWQSLKHALNLNGRTIKLKWCTFISIYMYNIRMARVLCFTFWRYVFISDNYWTSCCWKLNLILYI